jgi:uncharacterized protein (DUF849 family)
VRNNDGTPSSDPNKFKELKQGINKTCPGMIIQFSTGGRSGSGKERGGMLHLKPDMASLTVGSNNFPTRVYENSPKLIHWLADEMKSYNITPEIEAFDLSHIHQAIKMSKEGILNGKLYIQFVMGVKNAMPVDQDVFNYYVETVKRLAPNTEWCGAGIGAGQLLVNEWSIAAGGHTRTGLEDNIRLNREELAKSNAQLVELAASLCDKYSRPVATPTQARQLLKLN